MEFRSCEVFFYVITLEYTRYCSEDDSGVDSVLVDFEQLVNITFNHNEALKILNQLELIDFFTENETRDIEYARLTVTRWIGNDFSCAEDVDTIGDKLLC